MNSFEQILGVKTNASTQELKTAYYNLAKKHHPDKGGNCAYFQKITSAYTALYKHCHISHPTKEDHPDINIIDAFDNPRDLFSALAEAWQSQDMHGGIHSLLSPPFVKSNKPPKIQYPILPVLVKDIYNGSTIKTQLDGQPITITLLPVLRHNSVCMTKHKKPFKIHIQPYQQFNATKNTNDLFYTIRVAPSDIQVLVHRIAFRVVLLDGSICWLGGSNLDVARKYVVYRLGMPFGIVDKQKFHHRGYGNLIVSFVTQNCEQLIPSTLPIMVDSHFCFNKMHKI